MNSGGEWVNVRTGATSWRRTRSRILTTRPQAPRRRALPGTVLYFTAPFCHNITRIATTHCLILYSATQYNTPCNCHCPPSSHIRQELSIEGMGDGCRVHEATQELSSTAQTQYRPVTGTTLPLLESPPLQTSAHRFPYYLSLS